MQAERTMLEVKLEEERQSAAKGMELLLMAQQKFAGVLKASGQDGQNGNGSNGNGNGNGKPPEAESEMPEELAAAGESCPAPRKLYQR